MNAIIMCDDHGCIGIKRDQVFHLKKDLVRFKEYTTNKVIICGRRTLETFPKKDPLPNRTTFIVSHSLNKSEFANYTDRNVIVGSLDEAIMLPRYVNTSDIFVIGGYSIYQQLIPFIDKVYLTVVKDSMDSYYPRIYQDYNFDFNDKVFIPKEIYDITQKNPIGTDFEVIQKFETTDTIKELDQDAEVDFMILRRK